MGYTCTPLDYKPGKKATKNKYDKKVLSIYMLPVFNQLKEFIYMTWALKVLYEVQ